MDMVTIILGVIALFILVLDIIAIIIVSRTYFVVKERRMYQIILILLLPLFGAMLCIYLNREHWFPEKKYTVGNNTSISRSQAIDHALGSDHHGGR